MPLLGHLAQIALMTAALGVTGDAFFWARIIAALSIATVEGLVPLTFSGVGTRDVALVALLAWTIGAEIAAALGVLFWLRFLVPGLIGSPLLPRFLHVTARHRKSLS